MRNKYTTETQPPAHRAYAPAGGHRGSVILLDREMTIQQRPAVLWTDNINFSRKSPFFKIHIFLWSNFYKFKILYF